MQRLHTFARAFIGIQSNMRCDATSAAPAPVVGYHQLVSGFAAGVSGVIVGHPMDTAKVWLQHGRSVPLRSVADVRALYAGTWVPLLTVGSVSAAVFFANHRILHWQTGGGGPGTSGPPTASQRFWAGMGAGLAVSPATCVSQRLKTLLQTLGRTPTQQPPGGLLEVAIALHRTEGAVGFVRGWRAHTPVESCGRAVYFCSYDVVKSACMAVGARANLVAPREHAHAPRAEEMPPPAQPETPLGVRILAGGIAGGLGWLTVYPLDVVKARMMSQPPGAATYRSELHCAIELYRLGGVSAFVRGLPLTLVRGVPVAATVLPVHEGVSRLLQRS